MSKFIENAEWRYATKKFDATKKISNEDLETLKKAIQLSASSYGLQPYKILIIENPEIRAKLQPAAWGQTQIVDASQVIVFANIVNVGETEIDAYINTVKNERGISDEIAQNFGNYIKSNIVGLPEEARNVWTSKQTYIALGNLLNAAAELKIDVTPMEGFKPAEFNEILGLDKLGLNASLVATIGYRHDEDTAQHYKKVRKSHEDLFITI